ncbi:MAG: hypothetical protein KA248_06880 [Kiritimatiellae bacterium]|nr:hypothetical protein [Kiritimatiellia bacterium]
MKKIRFVAMFVLAAVLAGPAYPAATPTPRQLTLLVVPARYNVLQVAFDAASLAPVVLVSYQGDATTENPLLHAWNGSEWVYVSTDDFRDAQFLQVSPSQAILVGDEKLLPPVLVTSVGAWCPKTLTVPATDPAGLVNALGAHLDFSSRDWKWMASRYNMNLQDLNRERRQESWYDQKGYQDGMTPKLEAIPRHRRGRPAAGYQSAASAPVSVPPAKVVTEVEAQEVPAVQVPDEAKPEEPAPVAEPRLSIPAPDAPADAEEPKKGRRSRKADKDAKDEAGTPPEGWEEKASTADPLPVK